MPTEASQPALSEKMNLHVGTSGWGYASWKPDFYPKETKQKDFLRYYATQLNAVEVNYTFRHMLSEKSLTTWLAETPERFQFSIKAHQAITHFRRLKNAEDVVERFVDSVRAIEAAGKLGPALFQLPPNFKCDVDVLKTFLGTLPPKLRCAFEFRHESWFNDGVYRALSERDAALCIAENEEFVTPDVATGSFSYYRFRKPEYSESERGMIAERLRQAARQREVFAFFKHEEDPKSALWALDVLRQAREKAA